LLGIFKFFKNFKFGAEKYIYIFKFLSDCGVSTVFGITVQEKKFRRVCRAGPAAE
jgi:hypothetical protein